MKGITRWYSERGFAVFIVMGFLTLLLFLGMAVDWGIMLRYKRAMQDACDAGVLAGAQNLKSSPGTVQARTTAYASNNMSQNAISYTSVTAYTLDKNGSQTQSNPVEVRADINATVPMFFFQLVKPSVGIFATCTAEILPVDQTTGAVPIVMDIGTFQSNFGSTPCTFTTASPWSSSDPRSICQTDFNLKSSENSCGAGNSCLLDLSQANCGGGGAKFWGCVFRTGTDQTICATNNTSNPPACAVVAGTPGNKNGALKKGITDTGQTPPARCQTPAPPDPTSQWIVMVPLASNLGNGCHGKNCTYTVQGFAAFLLDCPTILANGISGNPANILGHFIYITDRLATSNTTSCTGDPTTACDFGVERVRLIN